MGAGGENGPMANPPSPLRDLDLKPRGGASFVLVPPQRVLQQVATLGQQKPFYHLVLGDTVPRSVDSVADDLAAGDRLAVWEVTGGPESLSGATLWLSVVRGVPQGSLYRRGKLFDGEAASIGLVALADALFRQRPAEQWLMTALAQPEPAEADEALSMVGFERVQGAFDEELGESTFGVRREVIEAQLAAERYDEEDEEDL